MAVALLIYKRRTRQNDSQYRAHPDLAGDLPAAGNSGLARQSGLAKSSVRGVALAFTVVLYGILWKLGVVA